MNNVQQLAQAIDLGKIGGNVGLGPFGDLINNIGADAGGAEESLGYITDIISAIIGIMTVAAFIWFIFQFLIGAIGWIGSGGDKTKLESARNRITNGLIGLVIIIAGWAILSLIGQFFGFDILIDPADVIKQLTIGMTG